METTAMSIIFISLIVSTITGGYQILKDIKNE